MKEGCRGEGEGCSVGSLGQDSMVQVVLQADGIDSSGKKVISFSSLSLLLSMSSRKSLLVLICLQHLSNAC